MASQANPLAGAKKALAKAQKFTRSVEGRLPSRFAPKSVYKMARKARKALEVPKTQPEEFKPGLRQEAENVGKSLGEKRRMVEEYVKATDK